MKVFFYSWFFIVPVIAICQSPKLPPTQAEIEAMLKKMQKQMDSVLNNPNVKKYANNPNATITGNNQPSNQLPHTQYTNKYSENLKLPQKDTARIKSIPKKNLSFVPGPLKPLWDKLKPAEEQPINKKVKIYKSN